MRILFLGRHLTYFRNFESVVRTLASRGHEVHLAVERSETLGGEVLTLPTPEARYDLEFVDLATYETLQNSIKKRKNILFVAPLDE